VTRVLVTGGRNYANKELVFRTLDSLHAVTHITLLIQGGAQGADKLASEWGVSRGVRVQTYHANWADEGRNAGRSRNRRMLSMGKPDIIMAFPGGTGTADMVKAARAIGKDVREIA